MKIFVKAKPNAKEEKVERIDASHFISRVQLISGFSAKQKMFEIIFYS